MPQANPPMFTNVLKIGDLENVGSGMGIKKGGASGPKNNPIMAGDWHFQSRTNGLRLHYGTFHALEDMTFSFELPPGLSLTMVFDGSLQFALSSHVYEMGKKFKPAECCGFTIDRPEVITRQLQKNDFVKKVNVFAEKDWLLACCQSRTEIKQLERVFHQHAQPKFWRPDSTILQTAGNIAQYGSKQGISTELEREAQALQLTALMLDAFLTLPDEPGLHRTGGRRFVSEPDPVIDLLDRIDQQMPSLEAIAEHFNISVSTLQRRFKSRHGVTVIDYIRSRKLDDARRLLVENRLSIGEIAYTSGYNHPSNFINAFIRRFGLSPGDYRKRHLR